MREPDESYCQEPRGRREMGWGKGGGKGKGLLWRPLREERGRAGDQREQLLDTHPDWKEKVWKLLAPPSPSACRLECQSFISGGELCLPVLPSFFFF